METYQNPDIYALKLHETVQVRHSHYTFVVTRVPGGWLYSRMMKDDFETNFVPYNEEFKPDNSGT